MINFIITLLLLLLILSLIIIIHEFGHFITAKKSGVHVSEFSLGMGPTILSHKPKKSETTYTLRVFPIGGYVAIAEKDTEDKSIKKSQVLENKKLWQKIVVFIAGIVMNFVLAFVLFFISGLIYGRQINDTILDTVSLDSPAYNAGLREGDKIISINNTKVSNPDDVLLEISAKKLVESYLFEVKRNNEVLKIDVVPNIIKDEDGNETGSFGIGFAVSYEKGLINAFKYSYEGVRDNTKTIFKTLVLLFDGDIPVKSLNGPVGIYSILDTIKMQGFMYILYIIAYLSINVGLINLLPLPVFDGGRIVIEIISAITHKKASEKIETIVTYISFGLVFLLMIYVTIQDILKLL